MSFKPITTQEELDAVLKNRLERAEEKYSNYMSPEKVEELKASYAGYASPSEVEKIRNGFSSYTSPDDLEKIKSEYNTQLANLQAENTTLKTSALKTSIISEMNLPASLASRLQGSNEEELRKDAKLLSEVFQANNQTQPLPLGGQDSNYDKGDATKGALRELAAKLSN